MSIENFDGNSITFIKNDKGDVMVAATEMIKIDQTKDLSNFKRMPTTKALIRAMIEDETEFAWVRNEADVWDARNGSMTMIHEVIALELAGWLSPKFKLWMLSTFLKLKNLKTLFTVRDINIELDKLYSDRNNRKSELIKINRKIEELEKLSRKLSVQDTQMAIPFPLEQSTNQ